MANFTIMQGAYIKIETLILKPLLNSELKLSNRNEKHKTCESLR